MKLTRKCSSQAKADLLQYQQQQLSPPYFFNANDFGKKLDSVNKLKSKTIQRIQSRPQYRQSLKKVKKRYITQNCQYHPSISHYKIGCLNFKNNSNKNTIDKNPGKNSDKNSIIIPKITLGTFYNYKQKTTSKSIKPQLSKSKEKSKIKIIIENSNNTKLRGTTFNKNRKVFKKKL